MPSLLRAKREERRLTRNKKQDSRIRSEQAPTSSSSASEARGEQDTWEEGGDDDTEEPGSEWWIPGDKQAELVHRRSLVNVGQELPSTRVTGND